ncbi:MAG: hypothetical protein KAU14_09370, partial [Thermoplasmata archaeon]|nr:hypothetical protein [Thermoplasmata archaeon]
SGITDAAGKVYFEIPEFYVTANNDGDNGDSFKDTTPHNPYNITASKDDETNSLKENIIDNSHFTLYLDLVEFDYSVSNLGYPGVITAGRTVGLVATVYNYGYNRETSITIEFYINDEELGVLEDFLMNFDHKNAHFNAMIPMAYANQDVVLKARTVFAQDHNNSNDEWVTGAVHVNKQPSVTITSPIEGGTVSDEVNITGTELDEDGTVDQVMVNITGGLDWTDAQITESWYYNFNTHSLANGDYELKAIAIDNNGAISDIFLINITVANKPTVSITSPADGDDVYGNTTVTMLGATQMLDTAITRVTVSIDDGEEINATETKPGWSQWSFDLKKGVK